MIKSVKLTNQMRDDILESVIEQWKVKNPMPKQKEAEHDFAMWAWNKKYGKFKNSIDVLPSKMLKKKSCIKICVNGEVNKYYFNDVTMPVETEGYSDIVVANIQDDNKEFCKYKKVLDEYEEWKNLGREIEKETKGILESVNTSRQLLEVWPQCEPFLPAYIADADKAIRLPAIQISRLNERIGF